MDTLLKFGSPILIEGPIGAWLFLLAPALFSALGAFLFQGSYMRILGASCGGASRDIGLLAAVGFGWLEQSNPHWNEDIGLILAFFGACSAAIGSCLAPYRGKLLWFNAGLGGFAGQFLLPYLMGTPVFGGQPKTELELLEQIKSMQL